jgi:PASTA domain
VAPLHQPADMAGVALSRAVELLRALPPTSPFQPDGAGLTPPGRSAAAGGPHPPGPPADFTAPVAPARRRSRLVVAALAGVCLVVGAVVAAALLRGPDPPPAGGQAPAPPASISETSETLTTTTQPATSTLPTTTTPPAASARTATPPTSAPGEGQVVAPALRTVPNVLGLHKGQAVDTLAAARFRVRVVEVATSVPRQSQRVVAQQPSAGKAVPVGSVVTVTVATKGPVG